MAQPLQTFQTTESQGIGATTTDAEARWRRARTWRGWVKDFRADNRVGRGHKSDGQTLFSPCDWERSSAVKIECGAEF